MPAQFLQRRHVQFVEPARAAIEDLKGPHQLPGARHQRHAEQIPGVVTGRLINPGIKPGIESHVIHLHDAAGPHAFSGDPPIVRDAEHLAIHSQGWTGHQLAVLPIPNEQAGPFAIPVGGGGLRQMAEAADQIG